MLELAPLVSAPDRLHLLVIDGHTLLGVISADEVRARIAPMWEHADSACLVAPPYGIDTGAMLRYGAKIAELFY